MFTICTDQFSFPKNGRESLKLVSKIGLNKWNINFPLEHSDQKIKIIIIIKNRTTISDVPLLITESLLRNEQFLLVFHIHWPPGISEICWQMLSNQQSAVLAVAVVVGG